MTAVAVWDHKPTPDELLAARLEQDWKPMPSEVKGATLILGFAGRPAEFSPERLFQITDVGWACAGELRSGYINKGYKLWLASGDVAIQSIEYVRTSDPKRAVLGLVLEDCPQHFLDQLRGLAERSETIKIASFPQDQNGVWASVFSGDLWGTKSPAGPKSAHD